MELITWYEKYSIKNEELDNDHKALFDIINHLYDNYKNKDEAINLVKKLVTYTEMHIAEEENFMQKIRCVDTDEHKYQNKVFRQKIIQLEQAVNSDDLEQTKELIVYIGYWLLNHVIEEDSKLVT